MRRLVIKLGLFWIYGDNPGPGLIWADGQTMTAIPQEWGSSRLAANLRYLGTWRGLVTVSGLCGFLWMSRL